ncbi:MAG: Crp/Fnr family transcriptional regulator [Caulobacter sp.]|nr:Crp/Fnr family transcriptional regulator [Caulobacter sp.]
MEFRNFLLSAIGKADLETLAPLLSEVSLQRGEVVFPEGGGVTHVYFPSSAVLSVVTVMRDGRYIESNTIGREGGAGLLDAAGGAPSYHRVFAQVPGSAFRLPAEAFRRQLEASPAFAQLLFRHALADAAQTQQFVACNVLHNAEQRLARWLLMTADRTGTRAFSLTQEYMAVMTGVQRTTISAMASDFKDRGLIRYSRGNMEILDVAGLRKVACECAGVAHELFLGRRETD